MIVGSCDGLHHAFQRALHHLDDLRHGCRERQLAKRRLRRHGGSWRRGLWPRRRVRRLRWPARRGLRRGDEPGIRRRGGRGRGDLPRRVRPGSVGPGAGPGRRLSAGRSRPGLRRGRGRLGPCHRRAYCPTGRLRVLSGQHGPVRGCRSDCDREHRRRLDSDAGGADGAGESRDEVPGQHEDRGEPLPGAKASSPAGAAGARAQVSAERRLLAITQLVVALALDERRRARAADRVVSRPELLSQGRACAEEERIHT